MKDLAIYCKHNWHHIGPDSDDTQRCSWCNKIWMKSSTTSMPKVQVGYLEPKEVRRAIEDLD